MLHDLIEEVPIVYIQLYKNHPRATNRVWECDLRPPPQRGPKAVKLARRR
jgi:hypothetical protein